MEAARARAHLFGGHTITGQRRRHSRPCGINASRFVYHLEIDEQNGNPEIGILSARALHGLIVDRNVRSDEDICSEKTQ